MKTITKIFAVFGTILLLMGYCVYDAFQLAPSRFTIRYEDLENPRIPMQMDGISILFFSDLEFGTFMDASRMERLVNTINAAAPDIVVFGGDLYDENAYVDEESNVTIAQYLKAIRAPLGKFAVYGDNDHASEEKAESIRQTLLEGDFELLRNQAAILRNKGSQGIVLVGLDSEYKGTLSVERAYSSVSRNSYVIAVCHTPDTADHVPADLTDYFLAGHSHGGQAYFFFLSFYTPQYATKYLRGKHEVNGFTLDITNGAGTTWEDVRFLAGAEAVLYRLHHAE